jgi:DNA-damage-inducible protein J
MRTDTHKNSIVKARVNSELKHNAEKILHELGLNMSETINALLIQIKLTKSIPFQFKIPNEETMRAIEETEKGIGLVEYKNVDDLFSKLELTSAEDKKQKRLSKRLQTSGKTRKKSR